MTESKNSVVSYSGEPVLKMKMNLNINKLIQQDEQRTVASNADVNMFNTSQQSDANASNLHQQSTATLKQFQEKKMLAAKQHNICRPSSQESAVQFKKKGMDRNIALNSTMSIIENDNSKVSRPHTSEIIKSRGSYARLKKRQSQLKSNNLILTSSNIHNNATAIILNKSGANNNIEISNQYSTQISNIDGSIPASRASQRMMRSAELIEPLQIQHSDE